MEFGPGYGNVALALARNGCKVTAVDIEVAYLDWIRVQASQYGVEVTTHQGTFGDIPRGSEPFDAVLFLEAFHHCLDHVNVLAKLQDVTTADAVVCIGDEPIFDDDDYWAATVPFPWGPRLDLQSIHAGQAHGWLELGFQERYVMDVLARTGWLVEKHVCSLTRRGTCYIAHKSRSNRDRADFRLARVLPSPDSAIARGAISCQRLG